MNQDITTVPVLFHKRVTTVLDTGNTTKVVNVISGTKQEQFNIVWNGLKSQGWQKSVSGFSCKYRGDGQSKCAVGHLIPDDQYDSSLEDYSPTDKFLVTLQRAHDAVMPSKLELSFRNLAKELALTIPDE